MATRSAPAPGAPVEAARAAAPSDAVLERIDDPAIAAALVTLLDNAELLSTLVLGLSGFFERGDTIIETVASSLREFKEARPDGIGADLPSLEDVKALVATLDESLPTLKALLRSDIVAPETIAVISTVAGAATEGMARACDNDVRITGALGALRALKDPDVARGVGVLIEIAKSLGRRVGVADPVNR